ncbi:GFA domain-containing protein [Favolaschia claudopus]|uniref:GFA domain-containing protein n=1 Tax=Favolaschia claudopus TaxID=2862362 RepID=A0AAW0D9F3_9AGAR
MPPADPKSLPFPWPDDVELETYHGGCHCKKIRYELQHPDIYAGPVMNCNCSICEDRGYLMIYAPEDKFHFTSGSEADLTSYEFGSNVIRHRFCKSCGSSLGPVVAKRGMVVINTRTIEDVDLSRLQLHKGNGKAREV